MMIKSRAKIINRKSLTKRSFSGSSSRASSWLSAKPLMRKLGVPATSRASVYVYNDEADVDVLAEALARAQKFFAH